MIVESLSPINHDPIDLIIKLFGSIGLKVKKNL